MSDIDRIFARLGGGQPAGPGTQHDHRSIPRRGGATGSRTVEVVRLPTRGGEATPPPALRADLRVRAASWEDGFPARSLAPAPAPAPGPAPRPAPVAHLRPAPEAPAALPEPRLEPPPPVEAPAATPRRARRPASPAAAAAARRVADPFDAGDDGANCLRCGYAIEPGRAARGLTTCTACR